ncbi:SH3-like domain-containing protein [Novosphingobium kunmingense]|uniref:SH3-like domain-containing protein n=1 Tax=Novosphingobium kunmingense TaxID=1211806 RepID=A0A2N0I2Z1_9SPHN|nr:SH3 domain-containing protein [Novosphingobium kunmingense]PKB25568.1 SH3-like domain-containing protein [Novosphingobium kunmingense]
MNSLRILLAVAAAAIAAPVAAQEVSVPYWASIRAGEVNMRAGPGEDYRIDWVYRRPQLPVKVVRLLDGWRLVEEPDGTRGWMLARFLTRQRSAFVKGQGLTDMREMGAANARLLWRVEPGVVVLLDDCDKGWCGVRIGERAGYIRQDRLWGAGEP